MLKKQAFIVSCQATQDEELFGDNIMTKMAMAALNGGADYIRTSQIDNIKDMLHQLQDITIIGLIKKKYPNSDVIITPTIQELKELIASGVHVIAIDATNRKRPKETLDELIYYFEQNKKPHQLLMADCSNETDVKQAHNLSFDMISTTLRGCTKQTKNKTNHENDFEFLKKARQMTNKYLIAEGGFDTPRLASESLKYVDAVVVGSAITRPRFITELFSNKIQELNKEKKDDEDFSQK